MRLETNWLIQEPIDLEHKQYVMMDYITKVNKDFEDFKLYPSFQELTLHVANTNRVKEHLQYITLNRYPEDIDDEILLDDLSYNKIASTKQDIKEIIRIADYARDKFSELFLVGKSIWSLLYDNVTIKVVHNGDSISKNKPGSGFFYLIYKDELFIYQYYLRKIKNTANENKCEVIKIYQGKVVNVLDIDELISIIKQNHNLTDGPKLTTYEKIDERLPIFRVRYEQEFPLEGSILSIARRKVMNYIFQTINIGELKND
jgi:hypothetical protein